MISNPIPTSGHRQRLRGKTSKRSFSACVLATLRYVCITCPWSLYLCVARCCCVSGFERTNSPDGKNKIKILLCCRKCQPWCPYGTALNCFIFFICLFFFSFQVFKFRDLFYEEPWTISVLIFFKCYLQKAIYFFGEPRILINNKVMFNLIHPFFRWNSYTPTPHA